MIFIKVFRGIIILLCLLIWTIKIKTSLSCTQERLPTRPAIKNCTGGQSYGWTLFRGLPEIPQNKKLTSHRETSTVEPSVGNDGTESIETCVKKILVTTKREKYYYPHAKYH